MFDYVACVSYGNDSIAMVQFLIESDYNNVALLYNDTGWADDSWPDRVATAEQWARSKGFSTFQTASIGMEALVKKRKGWPRQGMQFCTKVLKIEPTLEWLELNDPLHQATCCVGVKRSDGNNRKDTEEYVYASASHGGRFLWHPICYHSVEERDALIVRAGFEVLPHRSKECGVCVNENRAGLRIASPSFIDKIDRIEDELGFNSMGNYRSMFRPYRHSNAIGIREVIRWANAERGQFDPDDGTGYDCDGGMCGT